MSPPACSSTSSSSVARQRAICRSQPLVGRLRDVIREQCARVPVAEVRGLARLDARDRERADRLAGIRGIERRLNVARPVLEPVLQRSRGRRSCNR